MTYAKSEKRREYIRKRRRTPEILKRERELERARYVEQAADSEWRKARNDRENDRKVRTRYKMTKADREQLLASVGGCCQLCGTSIVFGGKGFSVAHVDHCHDTGVVRGILCGVCNTALGRLGDSIESIERVLVYLRTGSVDSSSADPRQLVLSFGGEEK